MNNHIALLHMDRCAETPSWSDKHDQDGPERRSVVHYRIPEGDPMDALQALIESRDKEIAMLHRTIVLIKQDLRKSAEDLSSAVDRQHAAEARAVDADAIRAKLQALEDVLRP